MLCDFSILSIYRRLEDEQTQWRSVGGVNLGTAQSQGKRRVVKTVRALHAEVDRMRDRCEGLEDQLELPAPWGPESQEYTEARNYLNIRKYRLALDNLERLVVQRLMELQKCHVRGTSELESSVTSTSN
jgi:hypothetical protein